MNEIASLRLPYLTPLIRNAKSNPIGIGDEGQLGQVAVFEIDGRSAPSFEGAPACHVVTIERGKRVPCASVTDSRHHTTSFDFRLRSVEVSWQVSKSFDELAVAV